MPKKGGGRLEYFGDLRGLGEKEGVVCLTGGWGEYPDAHYVVKNVFNSLDLIIRYL